MVNKDFLAGFGAGVAQGGGGGNVTVQPLGVTANGTYRAPGGRAYSPVTVSVANTFSVADEGKVVNGGVLVSQTAHSMVTQNGTIDTTLNNSVMVSVAGGTLITKEITADGQYFAVNDNADGYSMVRVMATDPIVTRTISGYYRNDRVEAVGSYAFYFCSSLNQAWFGNCTEIWEDAFELCTSLNSVSIPKCTGIGRNAFKDCNKLNSISFPLCTSIGSGAFSDCSSLPVANFPECTNIGENAFRDCVKLSSVSFPKVTRIESYAFYSCGSLSSVIFPSCTYVGPYAFLGCQRLYVASFPECQTVDVAAFESIYTALETAYFPECTTIGVDAFNTCSRLSSVNFDKCTTVGSRAFAGCHSLSEISMPLCENIKNSAFSKCFNLVSLYLFTSSVCILGINVFGSTPIGGYSTSAGQYGSVFVRASLLTEYQGAANWASIADRIVGLTDAQIEALG